MFMCGGFADKIKIFFFRCNRWLDSSEEDGATARELSADGPDGKPSLPWVHYRVQVSRMH
jgi:hypothetical protein